jgi:YfiH family protein
MCDIFQRQHDEFLVLKDWHTFVPELIVGFTTKNGGFSDGPFASLNLGLHVKDDLQRVYLNRKKVAEQLAIPLERWVCADQVHGKRIEKVTTHDGGKGVFSYETAVAQADGLYTNEENLLLALCFADCVPIYFFAPKQNFIGVAHAGWKGTVQNIAGEMVRIWNEKEGIPLLDIYVAIGPSIGRCCYIVDDRVIEFVQKALENPLVSLYNETSEGQYALDLKALNKQLLQQAGVPEQNILVSGYCTSCEQRLFFSHRRDRGKTGRMMAFIGRREKTCL